MQKQPVHQTQVHDTCIGTFVVLRACVYLRWWSSMQARDGELAEPPHDSTPCKASQGDQEVTRGPEPEPAVEGEGNGVETTDEVVHCFSTEPVDVPTCLHMALFFEVSLCSPLVCMHVVAAPSVY